MDVKFYQKVQKEFENCFDIRYRDLECKGGMIKLIYIQNLCDSKFISECIILPLLRNEKKNLTAQIVENEILIANDIGTIDKIDHVFSHILSGDVILFLENSDKIIYCEAKGYIKRQIGLPENEPFNKGSKESFVENIEDNVSLLRRKVKSTKLKFKDITIGNKSKTTIILSYLEDEAPLDLLNYIENKIRNMSTEFILDVSYIQEELECTKSFFETTKYCEKPDTVASKLFEGRVAILVDGSAFAITAPFFFIENFMLTQDYYENKYKTITFRLLLLLSYYMAIFLPGLFIAITNYHLNLMPTVLVFKIVSLRAGIPFPQILELLIMMSFFQFSRLAGRALPQKLGSTLGIVAALIIGEAAIGAGIASESTIIISGVLAVCGSANEKLFMNILLWAGIVLAFSTLIGITGFMMSIMIYIAHVSSLSTCGYPYMFPLATSGKFKFRDLLLRDDLSKISNNILKKGK